MEYYVMNNSNNTLGLKFIETYLRDGADSIEYSALKNQLYHQGYTRWQVIGLLVEGSLYGNIDTFHRKHPTV